MTTYCRLSIFSALTSLPSVALLAKEGPTRPAIHSAFGEGGSNQIQPTPPLHRISLRCGHLQRTKLTTGGFM
jgi:hypothetical protein